MADKITRLVVSQHHFLYLPLYFACSKEFFGLLPKGHRIEIIVSKQFTDMSAFEMMLDMNTLDHSDIDFAVCDPACALFNQDRRAQVVVLAGILTNSAFWAVNHKSGRGPLLKHLALFDKIISYKKGTTSFGIASRIFNSPEKAANIITVDPQQELHVLQGSSPGTLALSPDILLIQRLLQTHGHTFDIELSLAQTPEYRDMLVTALLTRADVLNSKPELVSGLLNALQRAMIAVRANSDEVLKYAVDRFREPEHTVRRALEEAGKADVYSASLKISEGTWKKLAEVAGYACDNGCTDEFMNRALSVYQTSVEPYISWAASALKATDALVLQEPRTWKKHLPHLAVAVPLVFFVTLFTVHAILSPKLLPWYGYLVLGSIVVGELFLAKSLGTQPWTLDGILLWIPALLAIFSFTLFMDPTSAAQMVQTLFGWDISEAMTPGKLLAATGAAGLTQLKWVHKLRKEKKARENRQ